MNTPTIIITFVVSFFAGVAVTLAMTCFQTYTNRTPKWRPLMWLSGHLFRHGIECIYPDQEHARKDILKDLHRTRSIKLYTFRGRSFLEETPDPENFLFAIKDTNVPVKLIIADPLDNDRYEKSDNPVKDRAKETGNDDYRDTLRHTVSLAEKRKLKLDHFEYKLHNNCADFRLIIFDQRLYLAFFRNNKMGPGLEVIRVRANSLIYNGFLRFFEKEFEITANPATPELRKPGSSPTNG